MDLHGAFATTQTAARGTIFRLCTAAAAANAVTAICDISRRVASLPLNFSMFSYCRGYTFVGLWTTRGGGARKATAGSMAFVLSVPLGIQASQCIQGMVFYLCFVLVCRRTRTHCRRGSSVGQVPGLQPPLGRVPPSQFLLLHYFILSTRPHLRKVCARVHIFLLTSLSSPECDSRPTCPPVVL